MLKDLEMRLTLAGVPQVFEDLGDGNEGTRGHRHMQTVEKVTNTLHVNLSVQT